MSLRQLEGFQLRSITTQGQQMLGVPVQNAWAVEASRPATQAGVRKLHFIRWSSVQQGRLLSTQADGVVPVTESGAVLLALGQDVEAGQRCCVIVDCVGPSGQDRVLATHCTPRFVLRF